MHPDDRKNLRWNYIANVLDGGFFGLGIGFASFTTVIPLFVANMTDSAILIGLISAIHVMGFQLPQLLMARSVSRLKRYKPMVMWMTINERVPFLGLALIALYYQQLGALPAILLTFTMLIWQGLGAGFTANAWQNMISKVIPANIMATFLGMQSSAANLLASGTAILAGLILDRQPFPNNYALCFLLTFIIFIFSYFALGATRESEHEVEILVEAPPPLLHSIREILRRDRNFRWFLVSRILVQFGLMAFSFYMVYADSDLKAGTVAVGVLTSVLMFAQVIFNPLLGWISDRWSRKGLLEIGAVAIFLSAIIARIASSVAWMYPSVILAAVANTAFWTITMAMTMQFGEPHERPTYIGMANTLIAPATILAPLVGGWLADAYGYPATFLFAALAGLASVVVFHFFVSDPQKAR
ncbi:MAG: MFS transporter [Chloroflexi bacterium]|nr:MAG: MFS transporter [Chloroflexota bacterium]